MPNVARSEECAEFAAIIAPPPTCGATAAHERYKHLVAVGDVRIDNRRELARELRLDAASDLSDLQLLIRSYEQDGERCFSQVVGDWCAVIWDSSRRKICLVRDALGARRLFFRRVEHGIVVSSYLQPLTSGRQYDDAWIAQYLLTSRDALMPTTMWADVERVPAGGAVVFDALSRSDIQHWTPWSSQPQRARFSEEAAEQFRGLFDEAVERLYGSPDATWAELSGGIDSSSVVVTVDALARAGRLPAALAGTCTYHDDIGEGNERPFVEAVLARCQVRNVSWSNVFPWKDDEGLSPPLTDEPRPNYPRWASALMRQRLVRENGGCVVLGGHGSDHYLGAQRTYVADLLRRGQLLGATQACFEYARGTQRSMWRELRYHGLLPIVRAAPLVTRPHRWRSIVSPSRKPAPWLRPQLMARAVEGAGDAQDTQRRYVRELGFHGTQIREELADAMEQVDAPTLGQCLLDTRYPFLYRPLIEFTMGLPLQLHVQARKSKWLLRAAMAERLPDSVRYRVTKGTTVGRVYEGFARSGERLRRMLRDPLVAQLGWVDARLLRDAFATAAAGGEVSLPDLMATLSLETWLVVRSGRWTSL
jgi:asparagine synthase (glutamine-hydrolysing)